ncbi:MAG TPA: hypothetical protein VGJ63_11130 [Micromonosporaceae bacterium]|jgi:hypothetical protein
MTQPPNGDAQRPEAVDPYATDGPATVPQPIPPGAAYPPPAPGAAYPPPGFPGVPSADPAPTKRRGLLIASIVLGFALLLCGGGGLGAWLYLNNVDRGHGAAGPTEAVDDFLRAVYTDQDADKAARLVCRDARDNAEITKKVDEIKAYATTYPNAQFDWDEPKVDDKTAKRATVTVKVTATTGDEREAEERLVFTVINDSGWWVCDVSGLA